MAYLKIFPFLEKCFYFFGRNYYITIVHYDWFPCRMSSLLIKKRNTIYYIIYKIYEQTGKPFESCGSKFFYGEILTASNEHHSSQTKIAVSIH